MSQEENIPTYTEMLQLIENYQIVEDDVFLNGLKSSDEYVIWYSVKACGLKRIEASVMPIFNFLGVAFKDLGNSNIRKIAVWTLSKFPPELIIPQIKTKIKDDNILLREDLADLLGFIEGKESTSLLSELIEDKDDNVILWASLSLSKHKNGAIDILNQQLFKQNNTLSKIIYLLDALYKINTKKSIDLINQYKETTSSQDELKYIKSLKI